MIAKTANEDMKCSDLIELSALPHNHFGSILIVQKVQVEMR